MAGGDEGFLKRWSRLKRARGGTAPEVGEARADAPPAVRGAGGATEMGPAGEVTPKDLNLPDIESMGKDSDFTAFLREGVPEPLKRLALRKLWRVDPVFSVIDGLDDYDEDFQTIMKVGTAAMRKQAKAVKKLAAAEDDQAEVPASGEPAPKASAEAEDDTEEMADDEPAPKASAEAEDDTEEMADDEPAEAADEDGEEPSTS